MQKLKEIFDKEILNKQVPEAYHLVDEYRLYIKEQCVRIKIYETLNGKFSYDTSHYYQSLEQASPYVSTINNCFDTIEEALMGAKSSLFCIYYNEGIEHKWIENKLY